jgi:hypothetical protein
VPGRWHILLALGACSASARAFFNEARQTTGASMNDRINNSTAKRILWTSLASGVAAAWIAGALGVGGEICGSAGTWTVSTGEETCTGFEGIVGVGAAFLVGWVQFQVEEHKLKRKQRDKGAK